MLLPVHDSVFLEVPTELVEETRRVVVAAMESLPAGFTVPLKVEIKSGRAWADCKMIVRYVRPRLPGVPWNSVTWE